MKRKSLAIAAGILTLLFIIFTIVVLKVDVANDTVTAKDIGLSAINLKARDAIGFHEGVDKLSTLVMLAGFVFLFAAFVLWLVQIFKYRSFTEVDCELYLYGLLAIVTAVFYLIFEKLVVNYRPILENGQAEASYPSSHILFIITLVGGAMLFIRSRIQSRTISRLVTILFLLLMAGGVLCRVFSGKHWLSDCVGAILLGSALLFWYEMAACTCKWRLKGNNVGDAMEMQEPFSQNDQSEYQREVRDYGKDANWRDSYTPPQS